MVEAESRIPLADLVDAVRAELEIAEARGRNQRLQFEVQDVQLDVEVVASGTREGEGGLKLWVVNLGGKGSQTSGATQKVTLKLAAVTSQGAKFKVSKTATEPADRTQ